MQRSFTVSVRQLAEFSLQMGDITSGAGMLERMNEGALGHKRLQSMLKEPWVAEAALSRTEVVDGALLTVQGRADALNGDSDPVCVLEIKTTQAQPQSIAIDLYPAHLAQGKLYAYIVCMERDLPEAEVQLCYYRVSDGSRKVYSRRFGREQLRTFFLKLAVPYVRWQSTLADWKEQSADSLCEMAFPFETYRAGQAEMAESVYRAMMDGTQALIEAPTGIGKTAAALYGALRALAQGSVTTLFYLTARTTGRLSAAKALELFRNNGAHIRSVTITAKDKCCLLEKRDCFGCPYASDYYSRRRPALEEGMQREVLDEAAIHDLAVDHALCPHELSLDLSEQADVIICDYNYVFDPRVHLKRYFDQKSKAGLLVDEAHNLPDRATDMLSSTLSYARVSEAMASVVRFEGKESPVLRYMAPLALQLSQELSEPQSLPAAPEALLEDVQLFVDAQSEERSADPLVTELYLDASWFLRLARTMEEKNYRLLLIPEAKGIRATAWCFNPTAHLRKMYKRVGGMAFFSGTVTPLEYYASALGLKEGMDVLSLPSPFPREHCLCARLPVSVRYNDRERTLEVVARIIEAAARAHPGNYIACFPSFAYMEKAYARFRFLCGDIAAMRQASGMTDAQRREFIDAFSDKPARSMVAFIVLGGVFAEGVDLPGQRLSGAVIVSTGMPQIGFERNQLSELLDDGFGQGVNAAYTYPGLRRVLQAAGRVIRTEEDKGVVLFVDTRYDDPQLLEWMPEHMRPRRIRRMEDLKKRLRAFWEEAESIQM